MGGKLTYNRKNYNLFNNSKNYIYIEDCRDYKHSLNYVKTDKYIECDVAIVNRDRKGNIIPFSKDNLDELEFLFECEYKNLLIEGDCYIYLCMFDKKPLWFQGYEKGVIFLTARFSLIKYSCLYCVRDSLDSEYICNYGFNNKGDYDIEPRISIHNISATYFKITNITTNKEFKMNLLEEDRNCEIKIDLKNRKVFKMYQGYIKRDYTISEEGFLLQIGKNNFVFESDGELMFGFGAYYEFDLLEKEEK